MIQSQFIEDILVFFAHEIAPEFPLSNQIPYLTETAFEYTGVGLFVSFSSTKDVTNFKLPEDIGGFWGVKITSTVLEIYADVILRIQQGIIDYLEIFSVGGPYPEHDLPDYVFSRYASDEINFIDLT